MMKKQSILNKKTLSSFQKASLTMLEGAKYPSGRLVSCIYMAEKNNGCSGSTCFFQRRDIHFFHWVQKRDELGICGPHLNREEALSFLETLSFWKIDGFMFIFQTNSNMSEIKRIFKIFCFNVWTPPGAYVSHFLLFRPWICRNECEIISGDASCSEERDQGRVRVLGWVVWWVIPLRWRHRRQK